MKKWITFDLDGTLMQNPFGKWVFPDLDAFFTEQLQEDRGVSRLLYAEHEKRMQENQTVAAYDWDDMVQCQLRELGIAGTVDVEELVRKHCVSPKIFLLEEAVLPVLRRLREQGYSLATVTNGFFKYQSPVMEALGLYDCFEEIVTPERAGCGKPDEAILDGLRQSGEIVAHVGDRLDHDVGLANRAGVPAVFIHRSLPDDVLALAPAERPRDPRFLALCEAKLKAECPPLAASPLPAAYVPAYAIGSLTELPGCL
ncbi:hypothetical protein J31TS4_21250 [Paenibacillus sp. J31TS4]|uniref:HAD family hydrolase n=1 Tax=Paenibacillus sp. J31TS4 TaxID=2807195 RepID=UPI001B01E218|nr:HAD family hydrolase [Paenibacillus sp. J31TS4]GIP38845.1 hypothetical protein J31TS4_21250 [Paenibacillus sp. J31TS4]